MGGFSFNPVKAITRAVGISDNTSKVLQAIFTPTTFVTNPVEKALTGAAIKTASHLLGGHPGQTLENQYNPNPTYDQPYYSQYYVAPTGFSDYQYQGAFAPQPYEQFNYEVPPWDYSIYSPQTIPAARPLMYQASAPQSFRTSAGFSAMDLLDLALPLFL